ncbi:MAG: hypothetical protein OXP36_06015 [Gammaproteobacteria bacterium]|nr:hypothetical protein [Gammaproteobacteria bacterium]
MPRHTGTVFVDTNVILECHRVGSWRALTGGYRVETVELCVRETQVGAQRRRREQRISKEQLTERLAAVQSVEDRELAELAVRTLGIHLDDGERDLWAHAFGRDDDWVLCGPDGASLRCGVRLGFRDRLRSLEGLLTDMGHRPSSPLREHYTELWHRQKLNEIVILEMD